MNDHLLEYLIDPAKSRILLEISTAGRITVKELCVKCPDIPRSSMYRHLTRMERDGVIDIVDFKQVRGTIERTYALDQEAFSPPMKEGEPFDGMMMVRLLELFCIEYIRKFHAYVEAHGLDPAKDMAGFSTAPVYATDEELAEVMNEIGGKFKAMIANGPAPGRRRRSIGIIMAPPED
jgi:DNA-binding transcriptional ArsR family regulator